MLTVNSLSGGQTSSYIAANYKADHNIFALVRIEDERCKFPDEKIRREVEDRIGVPFIATAEDDMIIYTMLDLEQFIGQRIDWVTGETFEEVIKNKGNRLPNKVQRWCTTEMKMRPLCYWWLTKIGEPVEMRVGYRANEVHRANKILAECNSDGLSEFQLSVQLNRSIIKKGKNAGKVVWRNKNKVFAWRKPTFELIRDNIYKYDINNFWSGKEVRFAKWNNCVGCHERNELLLAKQFAEQPLKMNWFKDAEDNSKGTWKTGITYEKIRKFKTQLMLSDEDFSECDSGYCEVS